MNWSKHKCKNQNFSFFLRLILCWLQREARANPNVFELFFIKKTKRLFQVRSWSYRDGIEKKFWRKVFRNRATLLCYLSNNSSFSLGTKSFHLRLFLLLPPPPSPLRLFFRRRWNQAYDAPSSGLLSFSTQISTILWPCGDRWQKMVLCQTFCNKFGTVVLLWMRLTI